MFRVNATGCSLVDNLYSSISFENRSYKNLLSRESGDGGLCTGGLTFSEALSKFASKEYSLVLEELTDGKTPDNSNIGGPGIVPIIHAAQVCSTDDIHYRFAGVYGRDANGRRFCELLKRCGFPSDDLTELDSMTPATDVLSDPGFNEGRGERTFINTIGAAGEYGTEFLPRDFFDADLCLFGATALVPPLHDSLDELCRRARENAAFVMVCTVFDFRNEAKMKGKPWPLVNDYSNIDLLVLDREESLKISGKTEPSQAIAWFLDAGCGSVIITQGADDVLLGIGDEKTFEALSRHSMPSCSYADEVVSQISKPHDTTGCGDNFVGGLLDSIARQLVQGSARIELEEAVICGIAAASLALTFLGGVYYEEFPGQKRAEMQPYFDAYRRELAKDLLENTDPGSPSSKKTVMIFGAGSIGRSFIAPVFVDGGYEAVFVEVSQHLLKALSSRDQYKLVYKSDSGDQSRIVRPVRAIDARDADALRHELNRTNICVTCVGANALPNVVKMIAKALEDRKRNLDIVLAENLKGAAEITRKILFQSGIQEDVIGSQIGIVESSIGKMVPILPSELSEKDALLCWAESYNTLIVDAEAFTGPIPSLPDLKPVSPIAPWVARKLYIHNFGHASAAYLGYHKHPDTQYLWQILEERSLAAEVRLAMQRSGQALCLEYPGIFEKKEIDLYIEQLLKRFQNRALGDTVYRVGRDLRRKLQRYDRIVGTLELLRSHGCDVGIHAGIFRAALGFAALNPHGDIDNTDAEVRVLTADADFFLENIVQISRKKEKALYSILHQQVTNFVRESVSHPAIERYSRDI